MLLPFGAEAERGGAGLVPEGRHSDGGLGPLDAGSVGSALLVLGCDVTNCRFPPVLQEEMIV